jgi:hypothetical protein
VLSSPIVIHVQRPYASEEEYLAQEGFSISLKSMILFDQPPLPADTAIIFDISLTNGHKPIRAEGVVLGYAEASAGLPGGVRVRFKRYGAATKAFIDRANPSSSAHAAPSASLPPRSESVEPSLAPRVEPSLAPRVEPSLAPRVEPSTAPREALLADAGPREDREPAESSGVHRKAVLPVSAPADREALLNRLRARRVG